MGFFIVELSNAFPAFFLVLIDFIIWIYLVGDMLFLLLRVNSLRAAFPRVGVLRIYSTVKRLLLGYYGNGKQEGRLNYYRSNILK